MKQLLSLFLLLLPCLAWAQYPSNGNQKITLGEQTTADGLFYRGLAADTTRKPSVDTMAYMLLDTATNIMWHYKKATSNAWLRVGGSISSDMTGTLPVANGGTNRTTMPAGYVLHGDGTAIDTSIGLFWDRTNSRLGIGTDNPNDKLVLYNTDNSVTNLTQQTTSTGNLAIVSNLLKTPETQFSVSLYGLNVAGNIITGVSRSKLAFFSIGEGGNGLLFHTNDNVPIYFATNDEEKMRLNGAGVLNIGYGATDNGTYPLQVNGQIFATNATIATSDRKFKENIIPLNKGLDIINKLKPVTYNFINNTKNNFSEYEEVGFIAQDVDRALSTETFAKSIVKASDDSDPNSIMGLATQNLIPILVKAIQEQNQLIKQLQQRIINLENK